MSLKAHDCYSLVGHSLGCYSHLCALHCSFLIPNKSFLPHYHLLGFHGGSDGKESACDAEDLCLIPELGRSPGEGNDNPLQYSSQEILWTEEPGRLQSMELQSDGHDLVTKEQQRNLIMNFKDYFFGTCSFQQY